MSKKISIKNITLDNKRSAICIPVMSKNLESILGEVHLYKKMNADIIEWRADYFDDIEDIGLVIECLKKINSIVPHTPIIFTLRKENEGGYKKVSDKNRINIIKSVIESKLVDLIDIEFLNDTDFKKEIIIEAKKFNTHVIMSYHDFEKTISYDEILDIMKKMREEKADIVKVAFTPVIKNDVFTLMNVVNDFNNLFDDTLVIGISMKELGIITRVAAGFLGSCLTFASGKEASAKGQIPIEALRNYSSIYNL